MTKLSSFRFSESTIRDLSVRVSPSACMSSFNARLATSSASKAPFCNDRLIGINWYRMNSRTSLCLPSIVIGNASSKFFCNAIRSRLEGSISSFFLASASSCLRRFCSSSHWLTKGGLLCSLGKIGETVLSLRTLSFTSRFFTAWFLIAVREPSFKFFRCEVMDLH